MKLLAVDTSSNACSVALQTPDGITDRHVVEPRVHTKVLMPMISEVLADGSLSLRDLDAIVLGNGPGSFIGMRIGASVVQGLCYAANIQVIPVSSLAAIAAEAFADYDCDRLIVAQDARMKEIYLGRFERSDSGLPVAIGAEKIVPVGRLTISAAETAVAGAAWEKYPALLATNAEQFTSLLPVFVPRARHLLALGVASADAGGSVAPDKVSPAYLRKKVAEIPTKVSQ
jgi:tRNA threonylcarbamoyladenosine biosynthesis protein TsaB